MSPFTIRTESAADHPAVFSLIAAAFEKEIHSDHREQFLVERLRKSDAFIPELSLVACFGNQIVGYTILTKISIGNSDTGSASLALAPVAVLPEYQGRGIGGMLITEAHARATTLGYGSVVVLGHEAYYPKFGYRRADAFGITLPFEVPKENCMVVELKDQALKNVSGLVEYHAAFYE